MAFASPPAAGKELFRAVICASKDDAAHPRKAVRRGLLHRGAKVLTTEEHNIWIHSDDAPARPDYYALPNNPYPDEPDPKRVHAIFLAGPTGAARKWLDQARAKLGDKLGRDEAEIVGRVLYLHTPDGFGRSELAKVLSRPGGDAEGTARNWATVTKLLAMCEA